LNNLLRIATALAMLAIFTVIPGVVLAASPNLVGYQGVLRDGGGNPLTGTFTVTFSIYVGPAGGSNIWTEVQPVTTDANGAFVILLGSVTALDETVFAGENRYLGITVSPDPEMTPRQRLASVPYAHRVGTVDSASGGTVVGDVVITSGIGGQLELHKPSGVAGVSLYAGVGGESGSGGATLALTDGLGTVRISMDADLGGDPSIQVPSGAISSTESSNEPGIASDNSGTTTPLPAAITILLARTIAVPSDGYVLAIGTCEVTVLHVNGTSDSALFGVSNSSGSLEATSSMSYELGMALPSGDFGDIITVQSIFPVSAGSHTFYFLADEESGDYRVFQRQLSLMFFPTAYGTVTPPSAPGSDSELESTVSSPEENATQGTAFNASRLEQELAILRTQADETTRRLAELEAMISAQKSGSAVVRPE
jgi:hypothetical protein